MIESGAYSNLPDYMHCRAEIQNESTETPGLIEILESIPQVIDKFSSLCIRITKEKPTVQAYDIYAVTIAKSSQISYTNFYTIIHIILKSNKDLLDPDDDIDAKFQKEFEKNSRYLEEQKIVDLIDHDELLFLDGHKKVNIHLLYTNLRAFLNLIDPICDSCEKFLAASPSKEKSLLVTLMFKQAVSRRCELLLLGPMYTEEDEIYFQPEDSEEWKAIQAVTEYELIDDKDRCARQYMKFCNWVILGNNFIIKAGSKDQNIVKRYIKGGMYWLMHFVNKKERYKTYNKFITDPDPELVKYIWGMLDGDKYVASIYNMTLTASRISELIFIPKTQRSITKEYLEYLSSEEGLEKLKKIKEYPQSQDFYSERLDSPIYKTIFHMNEEEFNPETHVQVRIISDRELPYDFKEGIIRPVIDHSSEVSRYSVTEILMKPVSNFLCGLSWKNEPKIERVDEVVIHIHGGGFMAMSSKIHQIYTRKWSRECNVPVFSIDYRLAPEHPYPAAIDDVWQAYVWIVKYSLDFLGITTDKIVLAGDSAGGALAITTTMLAIQKGFRIPDRLILCYPAASMSLKRIFPSILYSLIDPILNINIVLMMFKCYLKDGGDGDKDPYISPLIADDEIIKRFPEVRIMVGSIDPIRDMTYAFTQKLLKNKVDVKIVEYKYLPHGFLNYNIPFVGMKFSEKGTDKGIQWIQEVCESSKIHLKTNSEEDKHSSRSRSMSPE